MGEAVAWAFGGAMVHPQASWLDPCCPSACRILAWSVVLGMEGKPAQNPDSFSRRQRLLDLFVPQYFFPR